jgi:hypothetical protein
LIRPLLIAILCLLPSLGWGQSYWSLTDTDAARMSRWASIGSDNLSDSWGSLNLSGSVTSYVSPPAGHPGKAFTIPSSGTSNPSTAFSTGSPIANWSLSFWAKRPAYVLNACAVSFSAVDPATTAGRLLVYPYDTNGGNGIRLNGWSLYDNNAQSLTTTDWHHWVITNSAIWCDGALLASPSIGSIPNTVTSFRIGDRANSAGQQFGGEIYDVRLYSKTLVEADVIDLRLGPEPTLTSGSITIDQDGLTADTTSFSAEGNGSLSYSWVWEEEISGEWSPHPEDYDDPDVGPSEWVEKGTDGRSYRLVKYAINDGGPSAPVYSNEIVYEAPSSVTFSRIGSPRIGSPRVIPLNL